MRSITMSPNSVGIVPLKRFKNKLLWGRVKLESRNEMLMQNTQIMNVSGANLRRDSSSQCICVQIQNVERGHQADFSWNSARNGSILNVSGMRN
jgi:hypothetical protein